MKYKVTVEISILEMANMDVMVEADSPEEAKEKASIWEHDDEGDDYNNETISRDIISVVSCEVKDNQ